MDEGFVMLISLISRARNQQQCLLLIQTESFVLQYLNLPELYEKKFEHFSWKKSMSVSNKMINNMFGGNKVSLHLNAL